MNKPDNNTSQEQKKKKRSGFWNQMGAIVMGTTISLIVTIGAAQILERHQRAKDRRLTAMMVLSNIESSARSFEDMSNTLGHADTVGTWLLAQPMEELKLMPDDELARFVNDVTTLRVFVHDETAENIFSNNIDTWKNMKNFQFVDQVGQCFAVIDAAEQYYADWVMEVDYATKAISANPEQYEGRDFALKCLNSDDVRSKIARIHKFRGWLRYVAEVVRYNNRMNMSYIGITEEEVKDFTNELKKEVEFEEKKPNAYDFYFLEINPDSITTIQKLAPNF